MSLLEITGLTVHSASGQLILDDVSWSLDAGGGLGLIGESGSGKSMTALAILGLLPEGMWASGSVRLDGVELLGMPARRLRRLRGAQIAMVFQEPLTALDPLMSIGKQIAGPLRLHHGLRFSPSVDDHLHHEKYKTWWSYFATCNLRSPFHVGMQRAATLKKTGALHNVSESNFSIKQA